MVFLDSFSILEPAEPKPLSNSPDYTRSPFASRPGILYNSPMAYKVIETSTVTDEEIERLLNEWTAKGFTFESIHFVTSDASRRPKMAFLFFLNKNG